MAQFKPLISVTVQGPRRRGSGRSSSQTQNSPTPTIASSQASGYVTSPSTPPRTESSTPLSRLSTASGSSIRDQLSKSSSKLPRLQKTTGNASSSDEGGPGEKKIDVRDRGKARQVYGDSESLASIATSLGRLAESIPSFEGSIQSLGGSIQSLIPLFTELLGRETQTSDEEKLETATEEQVQSPQTYLDPKGDNERLKEELAAAKAELTKSQQALGQTRISLQKLQDLNDLSDPKVNKRKGRDIENLEMSPDNYEFVKEGWTRALDCCDEGWAMADRYKEKNASLKKEVCDLEIMINAYKLEHIRRKESQTDWASETEPEAAPKITESEGTEARVIGRNPDTMGEIEPYVQRELESTEVQDEEEGVQNIRQDDPQGVLQDWLQHDQQEVPQDEPSVEPQVQEELNEVQQEDNQHVVAREELQDRLQEESHDSQQEAQQQGMVENPQDDQKESEEEEIHSLDKEVVRDEGQIERLMSTTQEPITGENLELESPEQQDMVETTRENNQPAVEAPEEHSPPETQDVTVVNTGPEPATTEPVDNPDSAPVTSTEPRPKTDHHRRGGHRYKRRETGNRRREGSHHHKDESHHHRPSRRDDRPRNTERRIQRREQQTPVTYWIRSPSWMKTHFGISLKPLIRALKKRIRW